MIHHRKFFYFFTKNFGLAIEIVLFIVYNGITKSPSGANQPIGLPTFTYLIIKKGA
jgi:hypothetical protein